MDRNREARRASVVGSNGFNRRRHRLNSLRNSPDGEPELQESARLRERVKKDRERERDLRERSSRSKRRRADIVGDDTSEESVNDEDDEFAAVRFSSPPAVSTSTTHHGAGNNSSFSQQHINHHLQHRKTFPPSSSSSSAKVVRAPPVWKPGDETISAAVPRKARSASTKRSHDRISSSNNSSNGDQNLLSSPARHGGAPAAPVSPTSSAKNKLVNHDLDKNISPKLKSPKASSSSNAEELEFEIAEVLYGLMTQSQDDSRETNRFNDGKSLNSSSLSAVAPKRKRPRQIPEGPSVGFQSIPMENPMTDQVPKCETSERTAENGSETGGVSVISQVPSHVPESKVADEESKDSKDVIIGVTEDVGSSKEQEYPAGRNRDGHIRDPPLTGIASPAPTTINANLTVSEVENPKEVKFEIDLMLPPPERETKFDTSAVIVADQRPVLLTLDALPVVVYKDKEGEESKSGSRNKSSLTNVETAKVKVLEEGEQNNKVELKDIKNLDLRLDLEKPERDISSSIRVNENKSQPLKLSKEEQPLTEKPGSSKSSLPLTMPVCSGLPPMGFSQPRPKRCATHCHVARNIHCLQQLMKMNPFWPAPSGISPVPISLVGSNDKDTKRQQSSASIPSNVEKEKVSKVGSSSDSAQKKQQVLIQQSIPPATPSNLLSPGFVFPINQQQLAPCNIVSSSAPNSTSSPASLSFMSPNETQYLAILQNNAYPFPIPTPNYRAGPPPPIFNGPFYSPQMMQAQHNLASSQKQLQTQQQRPNNSFSSQKAQPKPHGNQYMQSGGNDDNNHSSVADNRGSRSAPMNIYGQNFTRPIHPQNFALVTPPNALAVASSSNQAEKKSSSQTHQQQQVMKTGAESLPPHTFAVTFGSDVDSASMAQVMQKNGSFWISQEAKSGDSANLDKLSVKEEERKSFAFADVHPSSSIQANNNARNSQPTIRNSSGAMNSVQNAQVQAQFQQQQMLQLQNHHQQQQMAVNAANRTNKSSGTGNGSIYSEHLNSSSMMGGKFTNTVSPVLPHNLVQRSNSPTPSPARSPQWKSSTTPVSSAQPGPSSLGSSIQTMHKNLPQQHSRNQPPMHSQISFGGNKKQPAPSCSQGPSPSTSSLSKGMSGSPRTNSSASTSNNKTAGLHSSPFTVQPSKNTPSILGNSKAQMQQHQSQQENMQQSQLFFSSPYSQSPHLSSVGLATTSSGGYFVPQRQSQRPPSGMNTNDPATAIAAATVNAKGGPSMMVQASPLTSQSSGFSYIHPVPTGVQVKTSEQKQPAG